VVTGAVVDVVAGADVVVTGGFNVEEVVVDGFGTTVVVVVVAAAPVASSAASSGPQTTTATPTRAIFFG